MFVDVESLPTLAVFQVAKEVQSCVAIFLLLEIVKTILSHPIITCRTVALNKYGKKTLNHSPTSELLSPLQYSEIFLLIPLPMNSMTDWRSSIKFGKF